MKRLLWLVLVVVIVAVVWVAVPGVVERRFNHTLHRKLLAADPPADSPFYGGAISCAIARWTRKHPSLG